MTDVEASRSTRRTPGRGLGLTLYVVAFACMLVAGAILAFAAKEFFKTTVTLWASVGFSALAIVLAVGSLLRRRSS